MDEDTFLRCYGFPTIPWAPAYMGDPADKAAPVEEETRE